VIKIEHIQVKDVNVKTKRNTGKLIGKIILGIGLVLTIVDVSILILIEDTTNVSRYINNILLILLLIGVFMILPGIFIISVTRSIGKARNQIEKAKLAFGPVEERALDGSERVINKYRVFLIKKIYTFEYKVMTSSEVELGYFEREGTLFHTIYRLKNLEGRPLLTIRQKTVTYIFYEGGEEDEGKFIGKLKHPTVMGKPKYWFEDQYKNKIIKLKGNGYYLYHMFKDGLKEVLVYWKGRKFIKVKIKPHIPDNIVIYILGITAIIQIDYERISRRHRSH